MLSHVARYADQWDGGGSPDEYLAIGLLLNERCRAIGRNPDEIRWVLSSGGDPLESEDTFRRHVRSYAEVGVRSFCFDFPRGRATTEMRAIAERVIPELKQEFQQPRES